MPPQDQAPVKDTDLEQMPMNLKKGDHFNHSEGLATVEFGGHVSLAEKEGAGMVERRSGTRHAHGKGGRRGSGQENAGALGSGCCGWLQHWGGRGALGKGGCNGGREGATTAERLKQRRKGEMAAVARLCRSRRRRQRKQRRRYHVLVKWKEETQLWVRRYRERGKERSA
ncbi:hypothetical protein BHE74_00029811 [Ensete ventricosum]|nr:hypothetical protein BHE74_00029811 [Ensete ventricosum]